MDSKLKSKISRLPAKPGVYLYKDANGEIIYIGKANNLRSRVRSYFVSSSDHSPKTSALLTSIADLDYILTDTEVEALMLENNLIKKHQPRYNIMLRDDKNYQFIMIDYSTEIPQITTARKIEKPQKARLLQTVSYKPPTNKYFGPYTSGTAVRETLRLLRYIFHYCANKKVGAKPCFYYHLDRCPGVCMGKISIEQYEQHLKSIERFLRGDLVSTVKELRRQMKTASAKRAYEKAARLRDQTAALEAILERQKIVSPRAESHDVIGVFRAGRLANATVFQIRKGRLTGSQNFLLDNAKDSVPHEVLQSFLSTYYTQATDVPAEIDTASYGELDELGTLLAKHHSKKIKLHSPARGRKRQLVKLAEKNAREYLEKTSQNLAREQALVTRSLFELKDILKLPDVPLRIECFDISNIQGADPTGSMVVFENGQPKKSDYKRFAVRGLSTPNDFAMMREVLERRFSHAPPKSKTNAQDLSWRLPDLLVIDGGRGQVNVALAVLKEKRLKIPVIGLAKRKEEICRPHIKSTLRLPVSSEALHLLQRLRDEAHRFAVTYHRKKRSKRMLGEEI